MYPGISHIVPSERAQDNWFSEHTILCAQNDDVDHINKTILKSFPGQLKSYCSIDKFILEAGADQIEAHYSSEYLNLINASGHPCQHKNEQEQIRTQKRLHKNVRFCNKQGKGT